MWSLSLRLLTLLLLLTCWPIMQKVRRHFQLKISTAYRVTNSKMFPLTFFTFFKLSFTVLFTIAKFIILSLRGWFPFILTSLLSSYLIFWLNYRTMVFTFFGFHSLVLGWSDFTRHYSQSLGWFPFLSLLKWFTSGSN